MNAIKAFPQINAEYAFGIRRVAPTECKSRNELRDYKHVIFRVSRALPDLQKKVIRIGFEGMFIFLLWEAKHFHLLYHKLLDFLLILLL